MSLFGIKVFLKAVATKYNIVQKNWKRKANTIVPGSVNAENVK